MDFSSKIRNKLHLLAHIIAVLVTMLVCSVAFAQDSSTVTAETFRVVNVRSGPSVDNSVIAQLESGLVVNVIGRSNEESDWLQIEFNDQTGWVAFFVITVTGDTTTLPIIETEQSTSNTEAALIAPEPVALANDTAVTASAYRRANVRTAPATSASILTRLRPGDVVVIIGRDSEASDWLQIDFNGQVGWVAYFLVSVEGDLTEVPIVVVDLATPVPPTATAAPNTILLLTRYNANLRQSASLEADVLIVIPFGTTLTANARTANGWVRVVYNGQTGWILQSLIAILDNGSVNDLALES